MHIKSILAGAVIIVTCNVAYGQLGETDKLKGQMSLLDKDTVAWVKSGQFNLGVMQGFLHNWAAGGEIASMQVNGIFAGNATHINHNKVWANDLILAYGLNYVYSNNFIPRKVDDRIDFTSKYGIRSNKYKNWYLTGLLNFRTQFTQGYDYTMANWRTFPVSNFLSPAYLTLAVGLEYKKDNFSFFFSPAAARFTFADDYYTRLRKEGAFGIEFGETSRFELGAYMSARYQKEITKTITYRTRLDLYSNYLAKDRLLSDGSVKQDNPGNIDVLFDNFIGVKVSKFVALTLGLTTIYDNDLPYNKYDLTTGKLKDVPGNGLGWTQINQVLNVGFTYKF